MMLQETGMRKGRRIRQISADAWKSVYDDGGECVSFSAVCNSRFWCAPRASECGTFRLAVFVAPGSLAWRLLCRLELAQILLPIERHITRAILYILKRSLRSVNQ